MGLLCRGTTRLFNVCLAFTQLAQPFFGIGGIRIEFERLFVIADGCISHVFMFAITSEDGVFGSKTLQQFLLVVELRMQVGNLSLVAVDDFQLATDEALYGRFLDVVAAVDGLEKRFKE